MPTTKCCIYKVGQIYGAYLKRLIYDIFVVPDPKGQNFDIYDTEPPPLEKRRIWSNFNLNNEFKNLKRKNIQLMKKYCLSKLKDEKIFFETKMCYFPLKNSYSFQQTMTRSFNH